MLVTLSMILSGVILCSPANATKPNPDHKVTLCHRTGSATNPYVVITTDIASDGYVKGGHNEHEQVGNGLGGDIIPAYEYTDVEGGVFSYPGKNLDFVFPNGETGAEVLAAGCVLTDSSPSPTPTDSPTPTETVTPPTSTSTPPVVTVTPPAPNKHTGSAPKRTAFTGGEWVAPTIAIGLLLALGTGCLWLARRKVS